MDAGFAGERFLAPASGFAARAQVPTVALTNVHGSPEMRVSTINLQTISDIGVDIGRARSGSRCHLLSTMAAMDGPLRAPNLKCESLGFPWAIICDSPLLEVDHGEEQFIGFAGSDHWGD